MMNKIITPEVGIYQIKKGLTIKIWKDDNKLSILLEEDTIDLEYEDVYELRRIISTYMVIHKKIEEN